MKADGGDSGCSLYQLVCYLLLFLGELTPFFRNELRDVGDAVVRKLLEEELLSALEVEDVRSWRFLRHIWIFDIAVLRYVALSV